MVKIIENENFIDFVDLEHEEIWLLNRTNDKWLDERVVNIPEITQSPLPIVEKLPKLLTEILKTKGKVDYKIITNNINNYMIHTYICEMSRFSVVENENFIVEH